MHYSTNSVGTTSTHCSATLYIICNVNRFYQKYTHAQFTHASKFHCNIVEWRRRLLQMGIFLYFKVIKFLDVIAVTFNSSIPMHQNEQQQKTISENGFSTIFIAAAIKLFRQIKILRSSPKSLQNHKYFVSFRINMIIKCRNAVCTTPKECSALSQCNACSFAFKLQLKLHQVFSPKWTKVCNWTGERKTSYTDQTAGWNGAGVSRSFINDKIKQGSFRPRKEQFNVHVKIALQQQQ